MEQWIAPDQFDAGEFLLRSYDAGDGPRLVEVNVESYEHLRRWMPWATPQQSPNDAEVLVRRFRAKYLLHEDFVIGVFSPDGRRLLGGSGFHLREGLLADGSAEIGMFLRASEAGKGLGTRVLAAMLRWGFSAWHWQRLSWRCDDRNRASMRVAEKNEMRLDGVLRGLKADVGDERCNTVCYGLTKPEFLTTKHLAG